MRNFLKATKRLPKVPAAERIDIDDNGRVSGLF
jgi:formyltetrahydrofolate synthetase